MKFDSIRWRLVISYVLLTLLTVGLVGVLSLTLLEEYVQSQTEAQLQANARTIARQAGSLMMPVPRLGELRDLARSMAFLGRVRVRILDERYNLMVDSGLPEQSTSVVWFKPDIAGQDGLPFLVPLPSKLQSGPFADPWMRENFNEQPSMIIRVDENPWGRQVIFEAVPNEGVLNTPEAAAANPQTTSEMAASARSPIGDQDSPVGYVQLDSPRTSGEQVLAAMRRALLLAGLFATLIAVVAGLLVSRGLTAPIQALAESADRMSSGDLSARAPVQGAGEIGQLARQFNRMAERLQASFAALSTERDALRRFIADASHELRTPVTALGSFIELLQGPAAGDPEAREEFLAESQAQVQRMEWITANLLNLSRLDAGLVELDRQAVELGDLLHASAAPFLPRAQEQGVRLSVEPPASPVQVEVDPARMEMALGNLLDNALKFTPAGGQVILRGAAVGERVQIEVQDSGSGIDVQDLPHIFERFYRGRTTREGSGLGLSIVQSLVQAHGGEVRVESQPGRGSRFTVIL